MRACGELREDEPRRLDAVQLGHRDVHHDDVGPEEARLRDGVAPVGGLADDLEVRLLAEEGPEPLADDPVVVHQEDGRAHSPCPLGLRSVR